MKRKIQSFFTLFLGIVFSVCLFACKGKSGDLKAHVTMQTGALLVIEIDETDGEATLYDAMVYLREQGEIEFESTSSEYGEMLQSINGVANGAAYNPCWMTYTSDTDETYSSDAQTYVLAGETYRTCNFGMSFLTVKAGETYIWVLQSF